jgi:hypothetical protein
MRRIMSTHHSAWYLFIRWHYHESLVLVEPVRLALLNRAGSLNFPVSHLPRFNQLQKLNEISNRSVVRDNHKYSYLK